MSATDIASTTTESTDQSFFSKHKTSIIVVIVVLIVILAWYYWPESKSNFVVSEISKKIDELIRSINKKQEGKF